LEFCTNGFGFKRSVIVENSGKCDVVSVDKFMEISRRVSDEPRVGYITLELIDLRHLKENVDNGGGGSGEIVSVEKNRKMIRWRDRRVINNRR